MTLSLAASKGARPKVRAANTPDPAPEVGLAAVPEPIARRLTHRADLLATYAALQGADLRAHDLAEYLWKAEGGATDAAALSKALAGAGLCPAVRAKAALAPQTWPALALMAEGHCVLVLGQEGATLHVYDIACPGNRAEVPVADFAPVFTGTVLTAKLPLADLAQRHIPETKPKHWFWGEFPKYRRQIGEVVLGSLVANLLAVAVALFSLQVYDRVIPHKSEATLWVLAAGVGLAIGLEALLRIARARLTDAAGREIELSVQNRLMQRLMGMRSDKRPMPPSGLFAVMREFGSVREFFTASTLSTLADIPFIAVFLLLIASIAGPVVFAVVAGGLLMVLPAYFLQRKMIALTKQSQGAHARAGRLLHEVLTELDTLKTQRGEERALQAWAELNEIASHATAEQRRLSAMLTHWSQGIQQATYIAAVVIGTYMVFAGEFTVGTIIATGILVGRTLAPLNVFAGTLARWGNVKNALEGLDAIANAPQERAEGRSYLRRDRLRGQFDLREVQFRYGDAGAPALDVPAISIAPGQRVAVLGVNGSGKSTLLKVLAGLYTPDRGRVQVDGTELGQIDPRDLRRGIGYLGQEVRLFAGTLRDNLNLTMLERDDARLMQALDFSGLGAFVQAHPKGLDLEIGDNGAGLSTGQCQSIGWARLWLQDPAVVILDEPTAALDQTLERTLISRLEAWLRGRTAIIATHRMPILQLATRTLVLQAGRMVVDGPRDEVLAHFAREGGG